MGYTPVPASTTTLCRYAALLTRKYTSIKQYLAIVRPLHLEWSLPDPLQGNFGLDSVLKGIRRSLGDPVNRKLPITPELLMELLKILDLHRIQDCNICGAALLLFSGMFRKSNVLSPSAASFDPSRHLRRKDSVPPRPFSDSYIMVKNHSIP